MRKTGSSPRHQGGSPPSAQRGDLAQLFKAQEWEAAPQGLAKGFLGVSWSWWGTVKRARWLPHQLASYVQILNLHVFISRLHCHRQSSLRMSKVDCLKIVSLMYTGNWKWWSHLDAWPVLEDCMSAYHDKPGDKQDHLLTGIRNKQDSREAIQEFKL